MNYLSAREVDQKTTTSDSANVPLVISRLA